MLAFLGSINTSINAVIPAVATSESSVMIGGPSTVIEETTNKYTVQVRGVGDLPYTLIVSADKKDVYRDTGRGSGQHIVTLSLNRGYHTLHARLEIQDMHALNNDAYFVAVGVPKPKVLLVGLQDSPLSQALSQVFVGSVDASVNTADCQ